MLLRNGYAYIPKHRLLAIIVNRFRAYLSRSLAFAYKNLPAILRDERLAPMLSNMSNAYMGPEFGSGSKKVGGLPVDPRRSHCASFMRVFQ